MSDGAEGVEGNKGGEPSDANHDTSFLHTDEEMNDDQLGQLGEMLEEVPDPEVKAEEAPVKEEESAEGKEKEKEGDIKELEGESTKGKETPSTEQPPSEGGEGGEAEVVDVAPPVVAPEPTPTPSTETVEVAELRGQVTELRELVKSMSEAQSKAPVQEEAEEQNAEEVNFLDGVDVESNLYDPAEAGKMLNGLANKVYVAAVEQTTRQLPTMVNRMVSEIVNRKGVIEQFYKENPDLAEHGAQLDEIAKHIISEEPDITLNDMLIKAASRFRMYKGLPAPSNVAAGEGAPPNPPPPAPTPPAPKARAGGRVASAPLGPESEKDNRSTFDRELDDLVPADY